VIALLRRFACHQYRPARGAIRKRAAFSKEEAVILFDEGHEITLASLKANRLI
jgi:hypothetical protein